MSLLAGVLAAAMIVHMRQDAGGHTFAERNSEADALGHDATQAPQPMQAAASMARSCMALGTGWALASGAEPTLVET